MLAEMGKRNAIPHALLLTGESGVGKTTIARILKDKLRCSSTDYTELNAAKDRGIDIVREIDRAAGLAPIAGPVRVWTIDEFHQVTTQAQESFLKVLEDTPEHVYFFLCTTDPQKLKRTIITRCTEIKLKRINATDMRKLLDRVVEEEGKTATDDVQDKIVEMSEGSARRALVLLHQVINLESEDEQLDALSKADVKRVAIDLCRILMKPKPTWREVAQTVKAIDDDAESVRWMVLGYMNTVALGNNPKRAVQVIEAFSEPYFNTKLSGLLYSCASIVFGE
jgi:DNA polymerase III gamma/tau subunit